MKFDIVDTKYLCNSDYKFVLQIGFNNFTLGIKIHSWGVRLMIIKYHVCITFRKRKKIT
jgi:hypothetical protein